jgi:hypothetical protein
MHWKRIISIFVLAGLFLVSFGSGMNMQRASAGDSYPPTADSASSSAQDVAPGVATVPQGETQTSGNTPNILASTGVDPNQGVEGNQVVQITLPAGQPPAAGTALASLPDMVRPEMTYSIKKSVSLVPGPDILLLHADDDNLTNSPIRNLLLAYGDLGTIDLFDTKSATPTLAQLLPYDVVVTWSNYVYFDPVGIGNVLADYVDQGGKVINMMFSIGNSGFQMQGRFMSQGYTAMNGTAITYVNDCLGSSNPSHPIMDGITSVCDLYRIGGTYLTAGSSSVAQWADGLLFVATKDDRSVVSINGYVGILFNWSGQLPDVVHNAILWLVSHTGCDTVLWNNGPLVTHIGGGYNYANASALQTSLGMNTYGFGNQYSLNYRMADDFSITNPQGWQVEQLTFYGYQTGTYAFPPAPTITGVYYQIWNGPPDDPASEVVFGDLFTNRLLDTAWIDTYRAQDITLLDAQRPVMAIVAEAGVLLPPGYYWVEWMVDGSLASGPWAPPITILGQTTTGNALQYTTSWAPANDTGTATQQDVPFLVQGCREKGTWQQINSNPVPLMDNVLAAYNGQIWSITGYGGASGVTFYDPTVGTWSAVPASAPPFGINYARSGCQIGSKVYIYGDTTTPGFTGLWSYNMAINTWTNETPGGTPPPNPGIWSPSWVADSATGRCYMTGGASIPGGGDLISVYVYNANTNQWLAPLPNFTSARDFHAAFLFTRPSDAHKLLCVVGGIAVLALDSTQCYDLNTSTWHAENSDLGKLPQGWWGMGYTQSHAAGGDRLWMVDGVDPAGLLFDQTWYYSVARQTWVYAHTLQSGVFYRTAAVSLNGIAYHVGGSLGAFSPAGLSDRYIGFPTLMPMIKR